MGISVAVTHTHAKDQTQAAQWPHNKQLAVALAYDDALTSHLDFAIPRSMSPGERRRSFAPVITYWV